MKQKIIIAILLISLILTGKVDAAILTQKIGSESMQTTVEANQIVKMKFTTKEGFRFKRWVIEEGTIEDVDLTSEEIRFRMPNSNVVIRGEYDTGYVVTFNANGGSGEMAPLEITAGGNKNLSKNTFTRTGYQFKGWSTEQDNTVEYQDQANCAPTQNLNLYAVWEVITYTIEYNGNGNTSGSTASSSHTYGEEKELTANGFSKTGHTFSGWSTSANGEVAYTDSQLVSNLSQNSGTITLYAKWIANTYTVKYNANGGSGSMSDSSYTYGETKALTKNTFTNTGYNFSGWALSTNGAVTYSDEQSVSNLTEIANGTVNIYAIWTVNSVTVKFSSNGGSAVNNKTVTYQGTYGTLETPSKTGYTFGGWYKESGLTNKVTSTTKVTNSATHTLYAKWTANTYEVEYNGNGNTGGSMSNSTHTYDTTSNLTANAYTKTGYTFVGWAESADGEVKYADKALVSTLIASGTKTLYAKWTANTYYVKYNANGGTGSMSNSEHTYGTASNLTANAFTREGYTFTGWSTTTTGSVEYADSESINTLIVSGTKDLYAVWTGNTYYVKYNANGGTGSMSNSEHTYGTASNLTANAFTRDGYTFIGWATSATGDVKYADKASVSTLATSGTKKLYAKWKAPWNEPVLPSAMKAVNWNGSSWTKLDSTADWDYNYTIATANHGTVAGDGTAKWANAVIDADGDGTYDSYYVWIPRFTYKVTKGNSISWNSDATGTKTAKTEIKFSDGTDDYTTGDYSGYSKHSAFTLKDKNGNVVKELEGFWIAKFEASQGSSNNPLSVPSVHSWESISANNMFNYSKRLNSSIGSHMLKDSEWGAVAYLTSAIGRIPYINNSRSCYTGNSGVIQNSMSDSGITNPYDSAKGVKASTTHNIYGVYDMSGGAQERTAVYFKDSTVSNISSLKSSYSDDGEIYVDYYTTTPTGDCARLGWDSDDGTSGEPGLTVSNPIPNRGGKYNDDEDAGIFSFYGSDNGTTYTSTGFRVALWGISL